MNLPAAQTGFNSLSPQQQQEHRAKIGVRVEAILGNWWRESNIPAAQKAMELEGWMDVLQNCSHTEIRNAWRDYQIDGPRSEKTGRLMKPDAGALYRIILRSRPKPKVVETAPEPGERMTGEQAKDVLKKAGVKVNEFGKVVSL